MPDEKTVTILLVDDEAEIRRVILSLIGTWTGPERFHVIEASDGAMAMDVCRLESVDVVVTDMKMPRMGGAELLAALKESMPEVLVVVMTGYTDIYTKQDAIRAGACEYISKPFDAEEVHLVLRAAYWKVLAGRTGGYPST